MVQVGAYTIKKTHRLRKPQRVFYSRLGLQPKRKLTEFKVSPDACMPPGTYLHASHFVPGQFVDCQSKTYVLFLIHSSH